MQAGEKLDFVRPFDGSVIEPKPIDTSDIDHAIEGFVGLCVALLEKFPANIKDAEIFEDGEYLGLFESTLRVLANDGSYLHVVVFGHSLKGGVLDFAINVTEHEDDGIFRGGYLYTYDADGFSRQRVSPEFEEDFDEPDRAHFSLIEHYRTISELSALEVADDVETRMIAMETRETLEQKAEFEVWATEMGYDGQTPSLEEVSDLARLLVHAEPYTPPASEDLEL